jgi:hypothetical protein
MALPSDALPIGTAWLDGEPAERASAAALQPGLGHRLHAVARLIRRRFERRVRQAGLPITRLQAALMLYVARNPGVSQTVAATDLDIEPIAVVRMLDRLHEEGLANPARLAGRRPYPRDQPHGARRSLRWTDPRGPPPVDGDARPDEEQP